MKKIIRKILDWLRATWAKMKEKSREGYAMGQAIFDNLTSEKQPKKQPARKKKRGIGYTRKSKEVSKKKRKMEEASHKEQRRKKNKH